MAEEHFLSEALLVGDLNARGISGRSLILIAALLDEDFNACNNPGCSSVIPAAAQDDGTSHKQLLLEYLLEKEIIPRMDKIDALEMAGAVLLGSDDNHEKFPLGFLYWRRALALRLVDKTPTKSKSGQLSEWSTLDELDQIEKDPAQRMIQSLLVRLRIASSLCWEAVYKYFVVSFTKFFWMSSSHQCSLSTLLDLSWTAVDTILHLERPHQEKILDSVSRIELWILLRFQGLLEATSVDFNILNSENLHKFVELFLMEDLTYPVNNNIMEKPVIYVGQHISNLCEMIRIISVLPEMMNEPIRESLFELVRRDGRFGGFNLMHCLCFYPREPHLPSIRLLVEELGANPNTRTNAGDIEGIGYGGALHILATKPESETRDTAARLLLDLGAHLDMGDATGLTAADYWLLNNDQERHRLPNWLKEGVPLLKCLSSRVMRRHRLPHDESNTPAVLIPFVALH